MSSPGSANKAKHIYNKQNAIASLTGPGKFQDLVIISIYLHK